MVSSVLALFSLTQDGASANLPTHKDRQRREGRKELCPESRAFECMWRGGKDNRRRNKRAGSVQSAEKGWEGKDENREKEWGKWKRREKVMKERSKWKKKEKKGHDKKERKHAGNCERGRREESERRELGRVPMSIAQEEEQGHDWKRKKTTRSRWAELAKKGYRRRWGGGWRG